MFNFKQFTNDVGILRVMLYILMTALVLSAPLALLETHKSGWLMLPTLIAPTIVPMLIFVIPLDVTMCLIQMSSKVQMRKRYIRIIWLDVISLLVLLLAWTPFFWRLVAISF